MIGDRHFNKLLASIKSHGIWEVYHVNPGYQIMARHLRNKDITLIVSYLAPQWHYEMWYKDNQECIKSSCMENWMDVDEALIIHELTV